MIAVAKARDTLEPILHQVIIKHYLPVYAFVCSVFIHRINLWMFFRVMLLCGEQHKVWEDEFVVLGISGLLVC